MEEESQLETLDELVEDESPPDGDDAKLAPDGKGIQEDAPRSFAARTSHNPALWVPLKRPLKLGDRGNDVKAVKRALHHLGGYYLAKGKPVTAFFGPYLKLQLRRWQRKRGIPATGNYGLTTHKAFRRRRAFDRYGAWLMAHPNIKTPAEKQREAIVATAMFGYHNRSSIHYTQSSSRMSGVRNRIRPPRIPPYEDCSSFTTWCYWVAGAPDPNGLSYNGQGYTGTQVPRGRAVSSITEAKSGDLIFYGRSRTVPSHVSIYIGGGKCVSHGNESGPLLLHYRYRHDVIAIRNYI